MSVYLTPWAQFKHDFPQGARRTFQEESFRLTLKKVALFVAAGLLLTNRSCYMIGTGFFFLAGLISSKITLQAQYSYERVKGKDERTEKIFTACNFALSMIAALGAMGTGIAGLATSSSYLFVEEPIRWAGKAFLFALGAGSIVHAMMEENSRFFEEKDC